MIYRLDLADKRKEKKLKILLPAMSVQAVEYVIVSHPKFLVPESTPGALAKAL
jgi:hypothetical protein